jgi:hypothetical protein
MVNIILQNETADIVTATQADIIVSQSAVTVTDGKLEYYYSSVKKDKDPGKWKSVSTKIFTTDEKGNYYFTVPVQEIAKGKEVDIYIAADADGTLQTKKISCNAAPKVKVTLVNLTSGPSVTVSVNKEETNEGSIYLESQYSGFKSSDNWYYSVEEGEQTRLYEDYEDYEDYLWVENLSTDGDKQLKAMLTDTANFGGATINVTYVSKDRMTPNATAKLKVSATPKAPSVNLKLAKAFSLKFKDSIEYRTYAKGTSAKEVSKISWTAGSGQAMTIDELFGTHVEKAASSDTDFVLNDTMQIQAKTVDKNQKKTDSRIATTTVYKSAATPSAVNAVIKNISKKVKGGDVTTGATITFATTGLSLSQDAEVSSGAVLTLQYLEKDGTKWKDVSKNKKSITYATNDKIPEEIYVRVKAVDYKAGKNNTKTAYYEAPGYVMTIKLDKDDPANNSLYTTTDKAISLKSADIIDDK